MNTTTKETNMTTTEPRHEERIFSNTLSAMSFWAIVSSFLWYGIYRAVVVMVEWVK